MGRSCSRLIVRWQLAVLLMWFKRPGKARSFGPSQRVLPEHVRRQLGERLSFSAHGRSCPEKAGRHERSLDASFAVSSPLLCAGFCLSSSALSGRRTKKNPAKPDGFTGRRDFYYFLVCEFGAEDETRTRTACGHYPLKIACLPVPPFLHNSDLKSPLLT